MRRPFPDGSKESISKSSVNLIARHLYFCHYNNAMYMGQQQNFQKHGLGMIIHDNGTSSLSSYYLDMLHEHNLLIFKDGSIASTIYQKDKLTEVLYRTHDYILFLRYKKQQPDGGAVLIRLKQEQIIYLHYKMGEILQKSIEDDNVLLNRVFLQRNYSNLFPKNHLVNIQFKGMYHQEIITCQKAGKIIIGFSKDNLLLNGLGLIMVNKNGKQQNDTYHVAERGYFKNSQLSGFGSRNFKNGNSYTGEFRFDQFQGTGILKDNYKNSWVFGNFQRGTLVDLISYGSSGQVKAANKATFSIHEKKTSWVNRDIVLVCQNFFQKHIMQIDRFRERQVSRMVEFRKIQVLRRIQQNFMNDEQEKIEQSPKTDTKFKIYKDQELSPVIEKSLSQHYDFSVGEIDNIQLSQGSPQSIKRRKKIFDYSPKLNPENKLMQQDQSVVFLKLQDSKQTQSKLQLKESTMKEVRLSFQKTPPRQERSSRMKYDNIRQTSLSQSKKSRNKSISQSKISHNMSLIGSVSKRENRL